MFAKLPKIDRVVLISIFSSLFVLFTLANVAIPKRVYLERPPKARSINKMPAEGLPVLMYHSISDTPENPLCVPVHRFRLQMKYLHEHEFHTISLAQLEGYLLKDESLPSKPILITFDDGNMDNAKTAFPIMQENGFTATLFVIGEVINKDGMVSGKDLQTLSTEGWDIGNHTYTHAHLPEISPDQQIEELTKTNAVLRKVLGDRPIKYFSYPIGAYDEKAVNALKQSGFTLAFTTDKGWVRPNNNPYKIPRINIGSKTSMPAFIYKVNEPYYNTTDSAL
jgi:peptidoglycan/xylan/chitin deacetylase (PgdA/CDA1 family)